MFLTNYHCDIGAYTKKKKCISSWKKTKKTEKAPQTQKQEKTKQAKALKTKTYDTIHNSREAMSETTGCGRCKGRRMWFSSSEIWDCLVVAIVVEADNKCYSLT